MHFILPSETSIKRAIHARSLSTTQHDTHPHKHISRIISWSFCYQDYDVAMSNKSRSNQSVCEKSMKLMTNIVKVSYISIAKIGFRTHAPPPSLARATHNPAPSLAARYPRNLRSHEPTVSYLVHPGHTNRSNTRMIKDDDENVDREAWDFINKVHAKNMKDASNEMTNLHEFVLPPPPHIMLQPSSSSY
ncbi:hypothetical protein HanXRQr2_Chr05g0230551 [Helianthus annuus]|uniref:Uncharacterized protein n=1 Tax=Helianthus annuus TaxID=4232 RepID=A0A9K3NNS0_HELAN|nr:hypothetical protein HanXRQr2_Chr05g0230551 [Helianthus annuus]KAJ0923931.1 hypothetical protein HanPSC8_Chr05g0222381 [Helianthus annuus]